MCAGHKDVRGAPGPTRSTEMNVKDQAEWKERWYIHNVGYQWA
jgi:hypothetical protein